MASIAELHAVVHLFWPACAFAAFSNVLLLSVFVHFILFQLFWFARSSSSPSKSVLSYCRFVDRLSRVYPLQRIFLLFPFRFDFKWKGKTTEKSVSERWWEEATIHFWVIWWATTKVINNFHSVCVWFFLSACIRWWKKSTIKQRCSLSQHIIYCVSKCHCVAMCVHVFVCLK